MNAVPAMVLYAALLAWCPAHAAAASLFAEDARSAAGKSFLDHVATSNAHEPSYSVPAEFAGPLVPARRESESYALLAASLGLMAYLGCRRRKALAAA